MTTPYTPATSGGGSGTNPFENVAGQVFNNNNINTPIVSSAEPSLHLSSRADDPLLNATTGTQAQLSEKLAQMPKAQLEALQNKLIATGLFPSVRVTGIADDATLSAYNSVLSYSFLYQYANPTRATDFTPDKVLAQLIQTKPKDKNETSTQVNLTNRVQAEQSLIAAFTDKLGRRPTDNEVNAFVSTLHQYETANPDTTNTTVAGDGSGTVKSQVQDNKGTSSLYFANDFGKQYVMTDPSVQGEYQAGQHLDFYNLALQALGSGTVSTGNTD
ncbi:MAG: hypothetical protein KGL35_10195 [Bradyrhizobium sp.]|nr:hypothetical protein [Bradyrhizobium sp.]